MFQVPVPVEQLRCPRTPVLNVVVAELAFARGVVGGFHPTVVDVVLEPLRIALGEIDLQRIVERAIALRQRIGNGSGGRNLAEQICARHFDDVATRVLDSGRIGEQVRHIQPGEIFLGVLGEIDPVEELRRSEQLRALGSGVGDFHAVIVAELEAEAEVPLLHVWDGDVLGQIVEAGDVGEVGDLAIGGEGKTGTRQDDREVVHLHLSTVGRAVDRVLLRGRAEIGDGDAEESAGRRMRERVAAADDLETGNRVGSAPGKADARLEVVEAGGPERVGCAAQTVQLQVAHLLASVGERDRLVGNEVALIVVLLRTRHFDLIPGAQVQGQVRGDFEVVLHEPGIILPPVLVGNHRRRDADGGGESLQQRGEAQAGGGVGHAENRQCAGGADVGGRVGEGPGAADVAVIDQVHLRRHELEAGLEVVAAFGPTHDVGKLKRIVNFVIARIARNPLDVVITRADRDLREAARKVRGEAQIFVPIAAELLIALAADVAGAVEAEPEFVHLIPADGPRVAEREVGAGGRVRGYAYHHARNEGARAFGWNLRDAEGEAVGAGEDLVDLRVPAAIGVADRAEDREVLAQAVQRHVGQRHQIKELLADRRDQ